MNKPLIDLKRATTTTPPTTPDPEPPATPAASSSGAEQEPKPKAARPSAKPTLAVVSTPTPPQTAPAAEAVMTFSVRIPVSFHRRMKVFCIGNDMELQEFAMDALTRHLEKLQSSGD